MEEEKKDDFPKVGCIIVSLMVVGFVIWQIISLSQGVYLATIEGGWKWLLFIGLPILLIAIIVNPPKKK